MARELVGIYMPGVRKRKRHIRPDVAAEMAEWLALRYAEAARAVERLSDEKGRPRTPDNAKLLEFYRAAMSNVKYLISRLPHGVDTLAIQAVRGQIELNAIRSAREPETLTIPGLDGDDNADSGRGRDVGEIMGVSGRGLGEVEGGKEVENHQGCDRVVRKPSPKSKPATTRRAKGSGASSRKQQASS